MPEHLRPSDHADAARLAAAAGRMLVEFRETSDLAGRALAERGDRLADDMILAELAALHPTDAVLSEESHDDLGRLEAERVWIIDPLDGSREYGEGRDEWAVHVALVIDHDVAAAAVAIPALNEVSATIPPPTVPASSHERLRFVTSRTRPPAFLAVVARLLDAELIPMGSAGAKTMAVVRGEADAYVHAGGQYEWDSAAPVGVARAAGLHISRLDGSMLRYNSPDPWLPDQVVCRPELAQRLLTAIRAVVYG